MSINRKLMAQWTCLLFDAFEFVFHKTFNKSSNTKECVPNIRQCKIKSDLTKILLLGYFTRKTKWLNNLIIRSLSP